MQPDRFSDNAIAPLCGIAGLVCCYLALRALVGAGDKKAVGD